MRGTWIGRLRRGAKNLLRDQGGNALMLTAAAIVPVLGIVGSGIDIGRGYMAKLRLQQACDAGVLAGRRYMGAGSYGDEAEAEALKMFDFNYPAGLYGSESVTFESAPINASDVSGTATTRLPTTIMYIFGFDKFDLTVNCAAKLEISNTDVMMVLDVTGSMSTVTGGKSRMTALKEGAMVFFDTITSAAQVGDGRLRIGIVPYSSTANVGKILVDEDPNWISDFTLLPSRSPVTRYNWSGTNPPNSVTNITATNNGSWSNFLPISGFTGSTACSNLTPPADSMPALQASQDMNKTAYVVDKNGTRRYVTVAGSRHYVYNYRYNYNSSTSTCWLQRRTVTYDHAASAAPSSTQFYNQYRYEDRVFDVSSAKSGGTITVDTGDSGANRSYSWSGCLIERRTSPFGASSNPSSEALDMDVDLVPSASDPHSQWRILMPEIAFPRTRNIGDKPSFPNPYSAPNENGIMRSEGQAITVRSDYVSGESSTNGSWQSFQRYWSNGWGVCPAASTKLTEMDSGDRNLFKGKIDLLQPVGGTYHDSGMVWGLRLMSPDGLFKSENAEAPNKRPIKRHIIFMTDGAMAPNMGNLTFQGYEFLMQRVSGSMDTADKPELRSRHNNRFGKLCDIARAKNITVWVIAFDLDADADLTSLTNCSTTGTVYQPKTPTELATVFQSIAGQISRLRLSQ